jgi:hypothetical protein
MPLSPNWCTSPLKLKGRISAPGMVSIARKSSAFHVMPSALIWQRFLFVPVSIE